MGKGVSKEEKRRRMLAIMHDSKGVFTLKELEKLGSKQGVGKKKREAGAAQCSASALARC